LYANKENEAMSDNMVWQKGTLAPLPAMSDTEELIVRALEIAGDAAGAGVNGVGNTIAALVDALTAAQSALVAAKADALKEAADAVDRLDRHYRADCVDAHAEFARQAQRDIRALTTKTS
jgi:hypothetical protein